MANEPTAPLDLIREALADLEHTSSSLSSVLRICTRIARLTKDYDNLLWLLYELHPLLHHEAREEVVAEVSSHMSEKDFKALQVSTVARYIEERSVLAEDKVSIYSVNEIEHLIQVGANVIAESKIRGRRDMADEVAVNSDQLLLVLLRIQQRVHDYLSRAESILQDGSVFSGFADNNRRYVLEILSKELPSAESMLLEAEHRLQAGSTEAMTHALTSCRRALKDMADYLYPPRDGETICADGQKRVLSSDKYISRLHEFVYQIKSRPDIQSVLVDDLSQLGRKLDAVYDLTSKGVHAEVTSFEADLAVSRTYMIIGDLLRAKES